MKKDKHWLSEQVGELNITDAVFYASGVSYIDTAVSIERVHDLIDQLDEPEVLSREWIDEHSYIGSDITNPIIYAEDLEELLVPKQELPVIPEYVAEWYESEGKRSDWWNWFYKWGRDESRTELESKTIRWMQDFNEELFVDMFRYGYEVEREQKYNVKFKVKSSFGTVGIFLYKEGDEVLAGDNFKVYCPKEDEYRLTEQEIRDFQNGDILFEHFAVKVKELEE